MLAPLRVDAFLSAPPADAHGRGMGPVTERHIHARSAARGCPPLGATHPTSDSVGCRCSDHLLRLL